VPTLTTTTTTTTTTTSFCSHPRQHHHLQLRELDATHARHVVDSMGRVHDTSSTQRHANIAMHARRVVKMTHRHHASTTARADNDDAHALTDADDASSLSFPSRVWLLLPLSMLFPADNCFTLRYQRAEAETQANSDLHRLRILG